MTKALAGMRVYDASQGVAGPHGTMLLALHGADVIKVEPLEGDWGRGLGQPRGDHTAHSVAFNRGKRSIALNFKHPDGKAIADKLIAGCNAFVESFRPGVAERMGLGYAALAAHNPALVYASVSGFGQHGPRSARPTVDVLIQAYSGMIAMNAGSDGVPRRQQLVIVDIVTGLYLAQAVTAALLRQLRFNEGTYLDINLMQSAAALQAPKVMEYQLHGEAPPPLYVPTELFQTADGYVVLTAMRDHHFEATCGVLERPDLVADPRFASNPLRNRNAGALLAEYRKELVKRTTSDWLKRLGTADIMAERIFNYGDWLADAHVGAISAVAQLSDGPLGRLAVPNIPGLPPLDAEPEAARAPDIGEHTRQILRETGYADSEIEGLIRDAVVRAN